MRIINWIQTILNKRAIQQTVIVTAGSLVNGLSLFGLNIILARFLDQESFGIFSLSVVALSIIGEISDFGLNAALLRFAPYYISTNQVDKLKQLVKTIWSWRVVLTAVLTIIGVVAAQPIAKYVYGQIKVGPYFAFTSIGVGGVILLGFLATFLQASQRFFYNASLQSLKGLLRLIVVVALVFLGVKNIFAYLSVYIFIPWVLFIGNLRVLPPHFRQVKIDSDVKKQLHSQLARFSFWLTVTSLVAIFSSKIDQIMVSHYLGLAQVAVFTVAWQLLQFFPVITAAVTSVLTPKISGLKNKTELIFFLKRILKWFIVGATGIALLVYPSQFLISIFFGQKYITALPVYSILAYSILLNFLAVPFTLTIVVFNKTHLAAISGFVQMFINILGNFIFIPRYGIMGAAFTFAIGNVVSFIWNLMLAMYLLKKKDFSVV